MLLPRQVGQLILSVAILRTHDDRIEEALELRIHPTSLDILWGWHTAPLYFLEVDQEGEEGLRRADLVAALKCHMQVLLLLEELLVLLGRRVRGMRLLLFLDYVHVA